MKKVINLICCAVILVVMLFARISFAATWISEADDLVVIEALMEKAEKSSSTARVNGEAGKTFEIPVVTITSDIISAVKEETDFPHEIEIKDGKICLGTNQKDKREYEISLGNSTSTPVLPDSSNNNLEGTYYPDFTYLEGEEPSENSEEYHLIWSTAAVIALDGTSDEGALPNDVSFAKKGNGGTFYANKTGASQDTTWSKSVYVDGSGNVVTGSASVSAPNVPVVEVVTGGSTSIDLVQGKIEDTNAQYTFNVADDGLYVVTLIDILTGEKLTGSSLRIYDVSGNMVAKSMKNDKVGALLNKFNQYHFELPKDGQYSIVVERLVYDTDVELNPEAALYEYDNPQSTFFEEIQVMMANMVMSIAKTVNYQLAKNTGHTITLDTIIFDEFDEVKLDFFFTNLKGEAVTSNSSIVNDLREPVNNTYNFFRSIVLVGYLIILVYVGIKILLNSTTANKKATYKQTLIYWITGIIILFFFPYFMKYVIYLNKAMVTYIATNPDIRSNISIINSQDTAMIDPALDNGDMETDFDNVLDLKNGKDFMSRIGALAEETKDLGLAIAYLIFTWQVIMMLIYYYKRVFVTAFLIIIFPFIAFTFVWDKLNDGKSQALSAWIKEFTTGVFIQTFHAVVYVFVTNTIYATLSFETADFILLLLASSFMFAGEEIIKQIFGGGGNVAYGSVAQTGQKIALVTAATTRLGTRVVTNLVGKNGFVRKTVRDGMSLGKNTYLLMKDRNGVSNFDKLAINPSVTRRVQNLMPQQAAPASSLINNAAGVVDALNHAEMKSPEDLANALCTYNWLMGIRKGENMQKMTDEEKKQFDEIMKKCKFSRAQLEALQSKIFTAAAIYNSGTNKKRKIKQDLRLEIEAIFPAKDADGKMKRGAANIIADRMLNASLINLRRDGSSQNRTEQTVKNDWMEKIRKTSDVYSQINFAKTSIADEKIRARAKREKLYDSIKFARRSLERHQYRGDEYRIVSRSGILAKQYTDLERGETHDENKRTLTNGKYSKSSGKSFIERRSASIKSKIKLLRKNDSSIEIENSARAVAVLESLSHGTVSAYDAYKAVEELEKHSDISEKMVRLSSLKTDINSLKYALARKIEDERVNTTSPASVSEDLKFARRWATHVLSEITPPPSIEKTLGYDEAKIDNRTEGILKQYDELVRTDFPAEEQLHVTSSIPSNSSNVGNRVKGNVNSAIENIRHPKENVETCARNFAILEHINDGSVSAYNAYKAIAELEQHSDIRERMLKISNIDTDFDTLKYAIAKRIDDDRINGVDVGDITEDLKFARRWAAATVKQMENHDSISSALERETQEVDPVISIYDILAAGKDNSSYRNADIRFDRIMQNAEEDDFCESIFERKYNDARGRNQLETQGAILFAESVLSEEGYEEGSFRKAFKEDVNEIEPTYEAPTYNGYTKEEIRKMRNANLANLGKDTAGLLSELVAMPVSTVIGASVGAAFSDDGLPIEEGLVGGFAGAEFSERFSNKFIPGLSRDSRRSKEQAAIEKRVNERIKKDEKERLKAKKAADTAEDKAKGNNDISLKIIGANANLYKEPNGMVSASVHVMAENATYVSIRETAIIPSSGWLPYAENVKYEFNDRNLTKERTLYVYVKDSSSNVKGAKISGIKI